MVAVKEISAAQTAKILFSLDLYAEAQSAEGIRHGSGNEPIKHKGGKLPDRTVRIAVAAVNSRGVMMCTSGKIVVSLVGIQHLTHARFGRSGRAVFVFCS